MKILKTLCNFLLVKHDMGFVRFCYIMTLPCMVWRTFCGWWLMFMSFAVAFAAMGKAKGWNKEVSE